MDFRTFITILGLALALCACSSKRRACSDPNASCGDGGPVPAATVPPAPAIPVNFYLQSGSGIQGVNAPTLTGGSFTMENSVVGASDHTLPATGANFRLEGGQNEGP